MHFHVDPFTNVMIWIAVISLGVYLVMTAFHYWILWRYPGQVELAKAVKAVEKADFMTALAELNQAIETNPRLWAAYLVRGSILSDMGHVEESQRDIEKYLTHNPDNDSTHALRSLRFTEAKRPYDALKEAESALKLSPDSPLGINARVIALLELKRFEEAFHGADQWMKKAPQDPAAHAMLGFVYQAQGKFEKALQKFNDSLRLAPSMLIQIERARSHFNLEHYDEMHDDLKAVMAQHPDHLPALELYAAFLNETGQPHKALAVAEQLVASNPDSADHWNMKGNVYTKLKDKQKQLEAYQKASDLEPKDGIFLRNLGYAHARFRRFDKALELTQRGMALDPDSLPGRINQAHYHLCLGHVDEAQQLLDYVLSKEPKNPHALEEQGWVYYVQNRSSDAQECWARVEQIKPSALDDFAESRELMDDLIQHGRFAGVCS